LVSRFSDFSVISYAIYNNQENCNTIADILLQGGPRKDLLFCNVAPGRTGRRGSPELSHSGGGFGRGEVEKVEGPTMVRFVGAGRWESAGERPAAGAQAGWPRCAPVRQCCGLERGRWCWASCGDLVAQLWCTGRGRLR
jgi:hypothetical protein